MRVEVLLFPKGLRAEGTVKVCACAVILTFFMISQVVLQLGSVAAVGIGANKRLFVPMNDGMSINGRLCGTPVATLIAPEGFLSCVDLHMRSQSIHRPELLVAQGTSFVLFSC